MYISETQKKMQDELAEIVSSVTIQCNIVVT